MWRIGSLKSLVALVIVVLGLTLLIMSRAPNKKTELGGFQSLDFTGTDSKEDVDMHYYSNHRYPKKKDAIIKTGNPSPVKEVVDYPFDDEENDFDPLSFPGEEEARKGPGGNVPKPLRKPGKGRGTVGASTMLNSIQCDINGGKYLIDCRESADEVYVPFSFLRKYYEIYGKMSDTKADTFLWSHSPPIKIYRQKKRYDPSKVFAFFDNYNVEVRDRVKCISGSAGVPVSTQWNVNGYFYPIQIAQFGLSHYSKYVTEKPPTRVTVENAQDIRGEWTVEYSPPPRIVPDPVNPTNQVIGIKATKGVSGINNDSPGSVKLSLEFVPRHLLILSLDLRSANRVVNDPSISLVNVTITIKARHETQEYFLHYVLEDFYIKVQDNHIFHGLGYKSQGNWQHIIRDIGVDIQKGLSLRASGGPKKKQPKIPKSKIILEFLSISNVNSFDAPLLLDNVTFSSTEHMSQFFQAVDWFVENQDSQGGWPIPVSRKFNQASNFYPTLRSGWYSAMGQGHGLSLLSRAFALTKDPKYSSACEKALGSIFDNPGTDNLGVRATFMDEYVWYEEYPTTPSSFVLNGFIYSLLGLYDVHSLRIPGATEKAKQLYNEGIRSLIKMLPLYDTGSGTFYDLRHFTVPGIAPNLARLDYHVTHINQLLILATIHEDPIFETTAARWIQYSEGERAPHN